jgi:hypothetical protein
LTAAGVFFGVIATPGLSESNTTGLLPPAPLVADAAGGGATAEANLDRSTVCGAVEDEVLVGAGWSDASDGVALSAIVEKVLAAISEAASRANWLLMNTPCESGQTAIT